jgi:hypothetical protein
MKRHYQNKLAHLITIIPLATGFIFFLVVPVRAKDSQQVINATLHQQENDFFKQGREKIEREIQLLLQRSHSFPENVLEIKPDAQPIQEQLAPLEKMPQVLHETTTKEISN